MSHEQPTPTSLPAALAAFVRDKLVAAQDAAASARRTLASATEATGRIGERQTPDLDTEVGAQADEAMSRSPMRQTPDLLGGEALYSGGEAQEGAMSRSPMRQTPITDAPNQGAAGTVSLPPVSPMAAAGADTASSPAPRAATGRTGKRQTPAIAQLPLLADDDASGETGTSRIAERQTPDPASNGPKVQAVGDSRSLMRAVKVAEVEVARWTAALFLTPDGRSLTTLDGTVLIPLDQADAIVAAAHAEGQAPLVVLEPTVLLAAGCPIPPTWPPPNDWWDLVVIACSGGKDSLVLAHQGIRRYGARRCLLIYNLLGDEHPTSPDEVAAFAKQYGVPLLYTWKNEQRETEYGPEIPQAIRDLYALDTSEHWGGSPVEPADTVLTMAERRKSWPGPGVQYCTADGKRGPGDVLTRSDLVLHLASERGAWPGPGAQFCTDRGKARTSDSLVRHVADDADLVELPEAALERRGTRIKFETGERRAESASRAKKPDWQVRSSTAPSKGRLVLWNRAILDMSDEEVWAYLIAHRIPVPASYWGLSRHSCKFCIFKALPEMSLMGLVYPLPLARRVDAEERMGHRVSLGLTFGPYKGFRAVWEFLYGPWPGSMPEVRPTVRPEAMAQLRAWWTDGTLHRPPPGAVMAGSPELPPGFSVDDPVEVPQESLWDTLAA